MTTIYLTPREYVNWFAREYPIDGRPMTYVRLASGREIHFDDMTDDDANLVAQQFMLWALPAKGEA